MLFWKNPALPLLLVVLLTGACKKRLSEADLRDTTTVGDRTVDLMNYRSAGDADARLLKEQVDAEVRLIGSGDSYDCWAAYAEQAQARLPASSPFKSVPIAEIVGMRIYTGSAYRRINTLLRQRDANGLRNYEGVIATAASGLNRLPPHTAEVSRGARFDPEVIDSYRDAKLQQTKITERGFLSTTFGSVEAGAFIGNVKFLIRGRHGRRIDEISKYPAEKEVLFAPGAEFRVTSVELEPREAALNADTSPVTPAPEEDEPAICRDERERRQRAAQTLPAATPAADADSNSGRAARRGLDGAIAIDGLIYAGSDSVPNPNEGMALSGGGDGAGDDEDKITVIRMEELE